MCAILLDIKKGDEIIMPSYTFVSTANAFALRGGTPVFVDIDPLTLNIDPKNIKKAISKNTKAIVVVHYAGVSCDMDPILEIAKKYSVKYHDSASSLMEACDGISIVTPTRVHYDVAKRALKEFNCNVFIEKPITKTVEQADNLIKIAKNYNLIIQVGHIERLNPALKALQQYDLNPKFIEIQRLAPYTERGTDVPVVLDLMIHDIDILLSLVKSEVKSIHASGVSILTNSVDIAHARIRFSNGTVSSVTSSRISKDKVRKIKIFQDDLYSTIDLLLGQY